MIVFEKNSETALSDMIEKFGDGSGLSAACFFFSRLSGGYCTKYRVRMAVSVIEDVFAGSHGFAFLASNLDVILVFDAVDYKLFDEAVYRLYYLFIEDPQIKVLGMEGFFEFYPLPEAIDVFMALCSSKIDGSLSSSLVDKEKSQVDELELFDFFDLVYEKLSSVDINEVAKISDVFAFAKNGSSAVNALCFVSISLKNLLDLVGSSFCVYLLTHLKCVLSYALLDFILGDERFLKKSVIMIELVPSVILSRSFTDFVNAMTKRGASLIIDMDISGFFMDRSGFLDAVEVIAKNHCDLCISNVTLSEVALLNSLNINAGVFRVLWSSDFFNLELSSSVNVDKRRVIVCNCETEEDFLVVCAEGFCLFSGDFIDSIVTSNRCVLSYV